MAKRSNKNEIDAGSELTQEEFESKQDEVLLRLSRQAAKDPNNPLVRRLNEHLSGRTVQLQSAASTERLGSSNSNVNYSIGTLHRLALRPGTLDVNHPMLEAELGLESYLREKTVHASRASASGSDGSVDKMKLIIEHGPFTKDELEQLLDTQLTDYFTFCSAVLNDFDEETFQQQLPRLRTYFIRRLARNQPLVPDSI